MYQLQQISVIIAFVCAMHSKSVAKAEMRLNSIGYSLAHVATVLKENAIDLLADANSEANESEEATDSNNTAIMKATGELYELWADTVESK